MWKKGKIKLKIIIRCFKGKEKNKEKKETKKERSLTRQIRQGISKDALPKSFDHLTIWSLSIGDLNSGLPDYKVSFSNM